MLLKIGQNFAGLVTNAAPDTGAGADPTAITGALYRNGVVDATVVVTAADEAATAGITKLTGAIPGTYAEGDIVTLLATATVGGVSSSWPVWHASIVARHPGELALAASVAAIPTTPLLAANYTAPDNAGITAIKAKTDNLPAAPAAVGSAMTLTGAYDAAKTAATQASVNAIPTTPLLAANYTAPDNAGLADLAAVVADIAATMADQATLDLLLDFFRRKKILRKEGLTWYLAVRNANDTGDILKKAIKDKDGNNITDLAAGAIAQELATEV